MTDEEYRKEIKSFLSTQRKFINGWNITRSSSFGSRGSSVFIYKDNTGKRKLRNIDISRLYPGGYYFYVENTEKAKKFLQGKGHIHQVGKRFIRVYIQQTGFNRGRSTDYVQSLMEFRRNEIETFEADLGPFKRLALDFDLQIEDWNNLGVLYFDIETDDTKEGIAIGRDRILSFAGVDRDGKTYFLSNKNEKTLLLEIDKLIRQFDMLVGWNSSNFDIPYLLQRYRDHKIDTNYLWNILQQDMLDRVQYFYSKDPKARQAITSYSLDFCSNYFLGEGKVKHKEKIIEMYNNDFEKFKEYNIQDAMLLKKLEDKLGTIELTHRMCQLCQVFPKGWSMIKALDNYILSEGNKKGVHFKTNYSQLLQEDDGKPTTYLGGYVFDPVPGYYENVYVFDFKSLYPNIIRSFNISPDSVTTNENSIITPRVTTDKATVHGGMRYQKKPIGIIASRIGQLLDEREEIKLKMKEVDPDSEEYRILNVNQLVVKELANSIYGVLGNKWYRGFNIEMAESITATGQYFIKYIDQTFSRNGRKVIYGDTDSVFMTLRPEDNPDKILDQINKALKYHLEKEYKVQNCTILLQMDKHFDKFFIEAKKKYVGLDKDKEKYVGMECVKRDTVTLVADWQKELFKLLFNSPTEKDLHSFVQEKKLTVLEEDVPSESLVIRKKIGKRLKDYKGTGTKKYTPPIHIRIAKQLEKNNNGEDNKTALYHKGSIIEYYITKTSNGSGGAEGVHVSEYEGIWDRTYYWNQIIFPPLERVLSHVYSSSDFVQYYIKPEKKKRIKSTKK